MRLVVIGAGGHGKVVADCAEQAGGFTDIVFLDGQHPDRAQHACWKIVGKPDALVSFVSEDTRFFVAIGNNQARLTWLNRILAEKGQLATLVHPNATVSPHAEIGEGTLVLAGAVVNAFAKLSKGCIVNTGASVDHDCELSEAVHIAPGSRLAGTVTLGQCTFLGVGSAVVPGTRIGDETIIGAGATVISDIPDKVTAVGTPAQIIKRHSQDIRGS